MNDMDAIRSAQEHRSGAVYVECRECHECGHVGLNDSSADATCALCEYSGPSPTEDICPACAEPGTMGAACPKCGGRYGLLADGHFQCAAEAGGNG